VLAVVLLALAAALLYAVSDFLEQRVAHSTADELQGEDLGGVVGVVSAAAGKLIRNRIWFFGWAVGTLAYLVQAAALHQGSVAVVQSLQVTTVLFSLPLSAIGTPLRPRISDYLAGGAVCLGLALFLLARGDQVQGPTHRGRILFLMFVMIATIIALIGLAIERQGTLRATLLAISAGVAFGTSATMVKLTSIELTTNGAAHTARDWPGYALALFALASVVLQQAAFASGKLPTATTAIAVTNPLIGTLFAVIGFQEALPTSAGHLAMVACGAVLIIGGLSVLPHSPLLRSEDPQPAPERGSMN
jgi:hypothetical protein